MPSVVKEYSYGFEMYLNAYMVSKENIECIKSIWDVETICIEEQYTHENKLEYTSIVVDDVKPDKLFKFLQEHHRNDSIFLRNFILYQGTPCANQDICLQICDPCVTCSTTYFFDNEIPDEATAIDHYIYENFVEASSIFSELKRDFGGVLDFPC